MAGPRIGSLFTGTGALDLAVMDVYGGQVVWHSQYEPPDKDGKEDKHQYAAKILERHWPSVPNLWDVTKVDWQQVLGEYGPVDVLTGGFPCTDVSSAGQRAGLTPDTRSGLWNHMQRAIAVLRPRLVVIENVEGLLSANADRGLGLDAEALEEEAEAGRVLRALGAVLGDLATIGFDAEWVRVAASEVGAPHPRKRVFVRAWPADADPADLGHEWGGDPWGRWDGPSDRRVVASDASCVGLEVGRVELAGYEQQAAERGGRKSASDADGRGCEGNSERNRGPQEGEPEREPRLDPLGRGARGKAIEPACPTCGCDESSHDAGGVCAGPCGGTCTDRELGRPESARQQGRPDAAESGSTAPANTNRSGRREDVLDLRPGQPDLDWGDYEPAIRRWERILGRPAPWPTDALGRLSAVFTEWLMGLPDGWVTATPGLTRSAMLRALGNGVVRLQASTALRVLHERVAADLAAAA